MFITQEPNDCSVCAVLNALEVIGMEVSREKVKEAVRYNSNGGFHDIGLRKIAEKLGIEYETYPKFYEDLIFDTDPDRPGVKMAKPEKNKEMLFEEYKRRLIDGWVAVTQHRWEDTDNYHAVALIGATERNIRVACSIRGTYEVDSGFFKSKRGHIQAVFGTCWIKPIKALNSYQKEVSEKMSITIDPTTFWEAAGQAANPRDNFLICPTEEEYWESGRVDASYFIEGAQKRLKKTGSAAKKKLGTVMDYGPGDGRVARFVADACKKIYCVDIASSVASLAEKQFNRFGIKNGEFSTVKSISDNNKNGFIDFLYCYQVIQHNPPDEQKTIMQRIYDYLKPGGLACIHFAKLENKPGYVNGPACMCFTLEQVNELVGGVFGNDNYEIEEMIIGKAQEYFGATDYFVWAQKGSVKGEVRKK